MVDGKVLRGRDGPPDARPWGRDPLQNRKTNQSYQHASHRPVLHVSS